MRAAGNEVKRRTQTLIGQTTGSGRVYRGGRYRASAPGDPPVMLTGRLRGSLTVYPYKNGEGFAVRERQFYSVFLEGGAKGGGNPGKNVGRGPRRRERVRRRYTRRVLAPRPHLDRVMAEAAPEIDRRIKKALDEGLKWRQTK